MLYVYVSFLVGMWLAFTACGLLARHVTYWHGMVSGLLARHVAYWHDIVCGLLAWHVLLALHGVWLARHVAYWQSKWLSGTIA